MKKKAVFLDRDGVITKAIIKDNKDYAPLNLDEFELIDGIKSVLNELVSNQYLLFVVTNQPDIARGKMSLDTLKEMNEKLFQLIGSREIIKKIYFCSHDNADNCECRKPKPGMLLLAAKEWDIDLKESFIIGDRESDVLAGEEAGCRTILIRTSYNERTSADYIVSDLEGAVRKILEK